MKVEFYISNPPDNWEASILSAGTETNILQSIQLARSLNKIDQSIPLFLRVIDDGNLIASLLLFHKVPFDLHKQRRKHDICTFISGMNHGWLEWQDGPVFHDEKKATPALTLLLDWIDSYARKNHLLLIQCNGFAHTSKFCNSDNIAQIFGSFGYKISKWGTYLINLKQDDEILWSNLKKTSARQAINKALRYNIEIRKIKDFSDFKKSYYMPFANTKQMEGIRPQPAYLFRIMAGEDKERRYSYFVAESSEGNTLATMGLYIFNDVATNIARAVMPEAIESKIPAGDLLTWEIIKYAKAQGCHTYDQAGVNPNPQTPKEIGIRKHQEKWGGRYVEYYKYNKEMLPWYLTKLKHAKNIIRPYYRILKRKFEVF